MPGNSVWQLATLSANLPEQVAKFSSMLILELVVPQHCRKIRLILQISRKKIPATSNRSYTLDGHQLECVSSIIDPGITITSDLSWSRHTDVTVAKANKTFGLLKRICYDVRDASIKKLLYCVLIHPNVLI